MIMKYKPLILKFLILCTAIYAILMMLHWPIGFTFFTQLSNVYLLLVVLLQTADSMSGKSHPAYTQFLLKLKFSACISIFVTFFVFMLAIAPLEEGGILNAYLEDHGASFCMHFLNPILAFLDYFQNDVRNSEEEPGLLYGILPPILYLIFIYGIGLLGVRWNFAQSMTAPYPFLNYAAPAGWFGFRPDTISSSTLGIGVFYCIVLLTGLFLLITCIMKRLVRNYRKGCPAIQS